MIAISWLTLGILAITLCQLLFLGSVIFLENRDPAKTIIWLLILGTLPILGALLYLVFSQPLRKHRLTRIQRQSKDIDLTANLCEESESGNVSSPRELPVKWKMERLLANPELAPLTSNNRAEVLTNGDETFSTLLAALEEAVDHIHLEYYIFHDDNIGRDILNLLTRKAADGVKVRLLVDGFGSMPFARKFKDLKASGVETAEFYPVRFPFFSSRLNMRNHRKIVLIDNRIGFIGGLNVGDEYLSRDQRYGFWRDTFLKLEGDSVQILQSIFMMDWYTATKQEISPPKVIQPLQPVGRQWIQIIPSGPDAKDESIIQILFMALIEAEKSIYIETPYFIPDSSTMMALKVAALSGLDVRLIIQGIPDHLITFWAVQSYVEELLEVGVRVYMYQRGLLHAKVLIIDDEIGVIGSTNFDIRSFYMNFEVSAVVHDQDFAKRLKADFAQDISDCKEILLSEFSQRSLFHRIKESGARLFSPLL